MSVVYVVSGKTERGALTMGASTGESALKCATDMLKFHSDVFITTQDGVSFTIKQFKAFLLRINIANDNTV